MATTSDFKNGLCIEFNDGLYTIINFQHVKPGKGPAFVRTRMKSLTTGKIIDNTFSAGVKINIARVERRPYQFLYNDELGYHFMHLETFEQITIEPSLIEAPELILEGQAVEIVYHADTDTPLACDLPPFVVMEVTYTEPGVRGDTSSSSSLKPAIIQTGATINVPLFINQGDKIKVDTRTKTYAERVK
jgi:elongation factor P